MLTNFNGFGLKIQKQTIRHTFRYVWFCTFITIWIFVSSTDSVTLTGSSEYAVPRTGFTLMCDVPEKANIVEFYRRPDITTSLGSIQPVGGQCYNAITGVPCTADVCSCVTSGGNLGTVFRWIIQPQAGDQGSVWFCSRTNLNLSNQTMNSDDYTLNLANGPGTSLALSPPDTTYTRTEGDTLPDITCTADCRPVCTFIWTRPDNTNFTVPPVLSLGQLDRSEHGTYGCTARNDIGESIITNSIIVQYGPSSVSLTPPTVTYTPSEGQSIPTITCSADCYPACTYSWTKDGQSYTTGSGLQLTNIQRGQTGVYRCTASNVHGSDVSVNINVIVDYGPSTSIALSPPDTTYTRTDGDTLPDITCTADCRPDCTFVWTRPDNTNFTVSPVLSLGQLDRSEQGTYRCTARNVVGESTITSSVIVLYSSGSSIALSPPDTTYIRTEGDTLPDITCTADCRPDCTFVWTRPDNTNFTVSPVLSLGQLDRSEHGTYTCTAWNVVGVSSTSIITTILYGPGSSLTFSPQRTSYNEIEGDTLPDITCTADCRPGCTFVWTRPDNTNFTVSPVLSLGQLDRSEHGTYRCTATNVVGVTTKVISVTVQCEPHPHKILHRNQTIDLQQSENLVLQATFTAVPAPSFIWTFQSSKSVHVQQLVNGTDDVMIQNTFDTETISARSVVTRQSIEDDWFGMYKVTATNAFGTAVLRFTVREKRNPGIPAISLAACTQPNSAEVSWIGGGDTQYYQIMFSDDRFLNSKEVYPSTIPSQADRSGGYSLIIENLVTGQAYFFKVTAYNSYGNTTSTETVGCVVREENNCGGVFVTGVVLAVVGVISLVIGVGLVIFVTRNRLVCCSPDQIPKPDKYQDIQLSEQDDVRQSNADRSPYQHLDTSKVAKPSVYSEIGGQQQGSENDNDGNGGPYESLEGRSNPNHYEELQSNPSGNGETYINTITPGDC